MGSDRTHSVRKELSGSPAATGDGAYLYGASFPASACYLREDRLRLIDLFRLRPFDPAAKRDDLRIGRRRLAAHQNRARMVRDHRAQEPGVADHGLGADQPNIKAAERFEGDGLSVVLDARLDGLFADTGGPRPERWWLCRPRASEPMDKASSSSSRPITRASTLSRAGRRSSSPARSCRLRSGRPPTPEYTDVVHQRGRELPHFSNRSIRLRWRL